MSTDIQTNKNLVRFSDLYKNKRLKKTNGNNCDSQIDDNKNNISDVESALRYERLNSEWKSANLFRRGILI